MTRMLSTIALGVAILRKAHAIQSALHDIYFDTAWLGESTLDDTSFQMLKAQHDVGQMWRFIRRVLYAHGATIQNESALNTFVPKVLDGNAGNIKSFDNLVHQLSTLKWVKGFSDSPSWPEVSEVNNTPTVNLFVAGVEGSGHHFLKAVFDECIDLGGCMVDPELSKSMWDSRNDMTSLKLAWNRARLREREEPTDKGYKLRVLNAYDRTDHPGEFTYTGMMAYPSFSTTWFPRADLYSQVASEAGDVLYTLVLVREPRAVLCSDRTRLRHNADDEVRALNSLVDQLSVLDPTTYHCVDYDQLPVVPRDLANFLGTILRTSVPVTDLLAKNFQRSPSTCDDIADDAIELYAQAQEPLFDLCRRAEDVKQPVA